MASDENREEPTVYSIPANYIDSGRILNGMLKTRNAIEAGFAVFFGFVFLSMIPFSSSSIKVTVMTAILGPIGIFCIVGVNDGPASSFVHSMLHWRFKRGVMKFNDDANPLKTTALSAMSMRRTPADSLAKSIKEWKEKQVIKQLQDEEDITFLKDPHVENINRIYMSYEERTKSREENDGNNESNSESFDVSLLQDVPNLNIGDLLTDDDILGGGFNE